MKNMTRYYVWEEPIGIYAPRQLGASEGYDTLVKARRQVENLKRFADRTFGTNIWILKATTVYKWSQKGEKRRLPIPRYEGTGLF